MKLVRLLPAVIAFSLVMIGPIYGVGTSDTNEVNIYSHRHYDTDKALYEKFEKQTGITVNVLQGKSDELIERLSRESTESKADILMTVDAGRLVRAQSMGLLQPVSSPVLRENVPDHLRDTTGHWFGLTVRARVVVYHPDRVSPNELSTYEDLTHPKWRGRILVRSSSNIYNQSLLASIIAHNGHAEAEAWASGIVANFSRTPQGNDRDQVKAVVAGEGDLALVNTYYIGRLINSSDQYEREVGDQVRVFFPNQEGRGTHINISGAAVTDSAKNYENALKLLEFLTRVEAQNQFSATNFEYPVNPSVRPSPLLE